MTTLQENKRTTILYRANEATLVNLLITTRPLERPRNVFLASITRTSLCTQWEMVIRASLCSQDRHVRSVVVVVIVIHSSQLPNTSTSPIRLSRRRRKTDRSGLSFFDPKAKEVHRSGYPSNYGFPGERRESILEKAHWFLRHALQHKRALQR